MYRNKCIVFSEFMQELFPITYLNLDYGPLYGGKCGNLS